MSVPATWAPKYRFTVDQRRFQLALIIVGGTSIRMMVERCLHSALGIVRSREDPGPALCLRATAASSVELSIVMRRARLSESLRRRRSPRLVQGIRTLVLLAHPVHDEHDHQYRAEKANYRAADHSWKYDQVRFIAVTIVVSPSNQRE